MNTVILRGQRLGQCAQYVGLLQRHFGTRLILDDPEFDIVPFPSGTAIIFSDRSASDIFRWRDHHHAKGTGDVLRFLSWESAKTEMDRTARRLIHRLSPAMRQTMLRDDPDHFVIGQKDTANALERRELAHRISGRIYSLTALGHDVRERLWEIAA